MSVRFVVASPSGGSRAHRLAKLALLSLSWWPLACTVDDTTFAAGPGSGNGSDDSTPVLSLSSAALTVDEAGSVSAAVRVTGEVRAALEVSLRTSDGARLTVSPSTLTFAPGVNPPEQTVMLSARDDDDAADEALAVIASAASLTDAAADVTVRDNDVLAIASNVASGVEVAEGGSQNVRVRLTAQPSAAMSVQLTTDAPSVAVISPATLEFTPANWSAEQTAMLVGQQDDDTVDVASRLLLRATGLADVQVPLLVVDDDRLSLLLSTGDLGSCAEGGSASFTVRLSHRPAMTQTVTLASSAAALTIAPTGLTFGQGNWSTPQTVTATCPQDVDTAGASVTVTLSSPGLTSRTVLANVVDDDTQAIVVSPTAITVGENGSTSASIRLAYQPSADVAVAITSADPSVVGVVPAAATLVFSAANYATPQSVIVQGLDDVDVVNATTSLTLRATGVADVGVPVTVTDDDTLSLVVSTSDVGTCVEGGSTSFTVRLSHQPPTNQSIAVTSNSAAMTLSPTSLQFSPATWSSPQTVTASCPQDLDADGATVTISVTSPPLSARSVAATVVDDDVQAIIVSQTSLAVREGTFTSISVRLAYQPTADLVVSVESLDPTVVGVSPGSLTFSPGNYAVPQTVRIAGEEDANATPDATVVSLSSATGPLLTDVSVSVVDNDPFVVVLQPATNAGKQGSVNSLNPSTSFPSSTLFQAMAWTFSGSPGTLRGFIDFDIPAAPPGASLMSATLTLTPDPSLSPGGHSTLSGPNDLIVRQITSPWMPTTTTWNNQPSSDAATQLLLPPSTSSGQVYVIDVTSFISRELASPSSYHGFFLMLANEAYYRAVVFATSNHPDPARRPKLVLEYTF
jgi:hypothetical protein